MDCRFCKIREIERDIDNQTCLYNKFLNIVIKSCESHISLDDFEKVFLCDSNSTLIPEEKQFLKDMKNYIESQEERLDVLIKSFKVEN